MLIRKFILVAALWIAGLPAALAAPLPAYSVIVDAFFNFTPPVGISSNQFGSENEGRSTASTPSGANQFGRSHPPREPNTALCAFNVSCNGLRRTPRDVWCSVPGADSL